MLIHDKIKFHGKRKGKAQKPGELPGGMLANSYSDKHEQLETNSGTFSLFSSPSQRCRAAPLSRGLRMPYRGWKESSRIVASSEIDMQWLLLIYKFPREPTASRVYDWRKLKQLGAIALQDAVWVLPATPRTQEQLQ